MAGVVLLVVLGAWALWHSEAFWRWSGEKLLALARERGGLDIRVEEISGHPLTGLIWHRVTVTTPRGEVLAVRRVEMRLSLWSLVKREPVIGYLALEEPHLTLRLDRPGAAARQEAPPRDPTSPVIKSLSLPEVVLKEGRVTIYQGQQTWQLSQLEGEIAINLLRPGQPRQQVLVRRLALQGLTPWGRLSLTSRFSYGQKQLQVVSLTAEAGPHLRLSLGGEVRWDEPGGLVRLAAEVPPVPGAELQRFLPAWPGAWELGGKFSASGSFQTLHIKAEIPWAGSRGSLEADLKRGPRQWDADAKVEWTALHPKLLTPVTPEWAERLRDLTPLTVRLQARVQGEDRVPEKFTGTLSVAPFRIGPRQVEEARLTVAGTLQDQQMQAVVRGNFGKLTLSSQGSWLIAPRGALKLEVDQGRPEVLGLKVPPDTTLGGRLSGTVRLPRWGAWREAVLTGDLEAQGRIRGLALRQAASRFTWEKGRLTLDRAAFHWGNLRGEGKGWLQKDRLEAAFQGSLSPGDPGPLPPTLAGSLMWRGTLAGDLRAPRFSLEGRGSRLSYAGIRAGEATLQLAGEGWPPRSGTLDFQGRTVGGAGMKWDRVSLGARGQGHDWSFSLKAVTGRETQAELTGTAALGVRPLECALTRVRVQLPRALVQNQGPVRLRLLPGLEIPRAVFQVRDGRLTLEARVQQGAVAGRLEADNLPADLVAVKGQPLEGRLRGNLTLNGEAGAPVLKGLLSVSPGRLGQFSFNTFQTSLGFQGRSLSLTGFLEQRPGGPRLTWNGSLPLTLSLLPFRAAVGQEDLKFTLKGDKIDLGLLTAFTPEVTAAEGPVDLSAALQGPLSRPKLSGEMRWGAGSLKLRQAGTPYRLQPGVIRLSDHTLTIPQLVLENGGTAVITGDIKFAGLMPREVDLTARLQDFKAVARQASEAYGTGRVTLKGPLDGLALTGHLVLPRASFRIIFFRQNIHEDIVLVRRPAPPAEEALAGKTALVQNFTMDVGLESRGNVWIRDPRFKGEVAGSIRAGKRAGEPVGWAGEVRALQGSIDLQGRIFKITEGTLRMPGRPRAPMLLQVRAEHEMTDVTLILTISGPVKRPEMKFSSIPGLPPQDILAYLLFGRPVQALNQEEYQVVNPLAVGAVGGFTAKKLQEFLGKDFPLVGDVTLKSTESGMGISKPLTKDISISFERKTVPLARDDTNQIRLEYRINRYLGVESQMGRRNTGADVLFNFDF
jgi:translocation and assembly module TamB